MRANTKVATKTHKFLDLNLLVEKDEMGSFIISLPGVKGAYAAGSTMQEAMANIGEVLELIKEHRGSKTVPQIFKTESKVSTVLPYSMQYA